MSYRDDPFFDVPKNVVSTSEGDVELPACYFDSSHYMALFRVKPEKVAEKLSGVPLRPALVSRKGVAVLSFFKYRDTSVGSYHEVGLAVLVAPEAEPVELGSLGALNDESSRGALGSYVLDLPVTTPLARAAGCEIWGYPKFVTELPIELDGDLLKTQVLDPEGKSIVELSGERGYSVPEDVPGMALVTYSMLDGRMLRTRVETRSSCRTSGGGALKLAVGDSEHRMAKNLRDLGLDGKSPKLLQTTELFQSLLFQGEPV